MPEDPKWKRFEKLVAKVQQDLAPSAKVTHNEKVIGRITNDERQVDVAVRSSAGQFNLFIAIECKDTATSVDVQEVESFVSKLRDIGADRGAMVAAKGFTENAIKIGKDARIELFRLVDAEQHDWKTIVSLPSLYKEIILDSYKFVFSSSSANGRFGLYAKELADPRHIVLFDENENRLGTIFELLAKAWHEGQLTEEPGHHEHVDFIGHPIKKEFEGKYVLAKVEAQMWITENCYFGFWPLVEISGFKDEIKGHIMTRKMATSRLGHEEIRKNWERVDDLNKLPMKPVLTLVSKSFLELDDGLPIWKAR